MCVRALTACTTCSFSSVTCWTKQAHPRGSLYPPVQVFLLWLWLVNHWNTETRCEVDINYLFSHFFKKKSKCLFLLRTFWLLFLDGVGWLTNERASTWQCWRSGTLQSTVCCALTSVHFRETLPNHSKSKHKSNNLSKSLTEQITFDGRNSLAVLIFPRETFIQVPAGCLSVLLVGNTRQRFALHIFL